MDNKDKGINASGTEKKADTFSKKDNAQSSIWQLKVPLISLILSTFYPGLGQIYNGDSLKKGLLFFWGCIIGSFVFLIPGIIIWIYGMYDAYSVADKMNRREIEYKETKNKDIILVILIPLVIMLILMFISLYIAILALGSLNSVFPDYQSLSDPAFLMDEYYKKMALEK